MGAGTFFVDHDEGTVTDIDVTALDKENGVTLLDRDGAKIGKHQ
jgi:hypothetical protein